MADALEIQVDMCINLETPKILQPYPDSRLSYFLSNNPPPLFDFEIGECDKLSFA